MGRGYLSSPAPHLTIVSRLGQALTPPQAQENQAALFWGPRPMSGRPAPAALAFEGPKPWALDFLTHLHAMNC